MHALARMTPHMNFKQQQKKKTKKKKFFLIVFKILVQLMCSSMGVPFRRFNKQLP